VRAAQEEEYWLGTRWSAVLTRWSAVFLVPGGSGAWPEICAAWRDRGLLERGRAELIGLPPGRVDYDLLDQGLSGDEWLPPLRWDRLTPEIYRRLADHFPWELRLSRPAESGEEVGVHLSPNQDGTMSIHVEVPCEEVFPGSGPQVEALEAFVDLASRFFLSALFLIGLMGEEERVDGLCHLREREDRAFDPAFYGSALWSALGPGICDLLASARQCRLWTRWNEDARSPPVVRAVAARPGRPRRVNDGGGAGRPGVKGEEEFPGWSPAAPGKASPTREAVYGLIVERNTS